MEIRKLETTDAFVVHDLGADVPAVGIVRVAPKILTDGAELLARSWTYLFASFEQRRGGASAGINAAPDGRDEAIGAFVSEVSGWDAALCLDPGKGVAASAIEGLPDDRHPLYREHAHELRGFGAGQCADAAVGLEGKAVVIEGFDDAGPALVKAVYDRGGRVVSIGTAKGAVTHPKGLDGPMLAQAWREHGPALVEHVDVLNQPAATVWEQESDVLFCGSKTGLVTADLAASLRTGAVVPTGPVPVTAKALAALRRSGVVVLPDFITTAAPMFAMWPGDDASIDGIRGSATIALLGALGEVLEHPAGPVIGACERAEAYLTTWQDELPTYRPLA